MKRIIAIGLSVSLLIVTFAGCTDNKMSDSEISKMLTSAFEKVETLNDIYANNSTVVSYDFGTSAYSVDTETSIKETNIGDTDKYEMSTDVTVKSLGSESTYETFYKDGFYYTSRYGGKFKTKMDLQDVEATLSISLIKVSFDDMRTVATKTVKEDSSGEEQELTYISFTCKNKVLKEYMQESFVDSGTKFDSATISSSKGEYIINKDGYLVSEQLSINAKITVGGEETSTSIYAKTVFSDIGSEVNPYDPEDSEYTEIKELSDVISLNNAIGDVITAVNVDMEMEMTTEIKQDTNRSGYKRSYFRKMSTEDENFAQEVATSYSDGETYGDEYKSLQYYTDGTFYSESDQTGIKLKSEIEFSEFYSSIYASTYKTPVSVYSTGMMNNLKSSKSDKDTVYSFELNPTSDEGVAFLQMLFGPYEQFGGDCAAAKTVINSFEGKSYLNEDGEYYKTVMKCDLLIKFEEGDVEVKCEQTIKVNSTKREEIEIDFPKFKGYEEWDKADLLSAFA